MHVCKEAPGLPINFDYNDAGLYYHWGACLARFHNISTQDLVAFSWFLDYKAMNIYLWTKHNWQGDMAPGGVKTTIWLDRLKHMIVTDEWKLSLDHILDDLKI